MEEGGARVTANDNLRPYNITGSRAKLIFPDLEPSSAKCSHSHLAGQVIKIGIMASPVGAPPLGSDPWLVTLKNRQKLEAERRRPVVCCHQMKKLIERRLRTYTKSDLRFDEITGALKHLCRRLDHISHAKAKLGACCSIFQQPD